MIISPPFLSAAQPQQNDAMSTADAGNTVVPDGDVCAANMLECSPGNGAYPVSFNLGWHGGAHLIAPTDGNQPASVRAIADGKIVHMRATDTTKSPALQYRGVRTDDGCVVIRHDTEIGEGDNAKITFYSVYMHLQNVMPTLAVGKKIYRKDILGTPGQIYGQFPQIHFEIVCDEANLKKIIGREPGPVGQTGRTDAVYGDIWFFVPRGAKIFAKEPHPYRDDDSAPAVGGLHSQASLIEAGTSCDLVIRMHYEKDCALTAYVQDAGGNWSASGALETEGDAEYNLYKRATDLQGRYNDGSLRGVNGLTTPSPSAIFEMIRFGRCIGEQIPNGARFNHWRKVNTPDGEGWVNLSMAGVRVYSDADFPEWAGWSFIKDDPTPDSLCDSLTIKQWLDVNQSGHVTHADAVGALRTDAVRQRLAYAICKFPTEWSRIGRFDRYMWLKSPHEALKNPLSDEDFLKLMEHARVLGFWEDIVDPDLPPANECWHFPPTAFLSHLKTCEWLSLDELTQLLPRHYGLNQARSTLDWHVAQGRLSGNPISYADISKAFRKYRISTANRRIAYLSQAYIETGLLRTTAEDGRGTGSGGNAKYYRAFYGRGLMQLTWPVLYDDYGKFRGFQNNNSGHYTDERITSTSLHDWSGPPSIDKEGRVSEDKRVWYPRYDPDLVASDGMSACDSAGFFLFWKHYMGTTNILRIADEGMTTTTVGRISVLVNGGGSGYDDRQQYAAFLLRYLSDSTDAEASAMLSYRKQRITSVSHPHRHVEWGEYPDIAHVYVDFTPQRGS